MVCKKEWFLNNFVQPLKELEKYVIDNQAHKKIMILLSNKQKKPEGCAIM